MVLRMRTLLPARLRRGMLILAVLGSVGCSDAQPEAARIESPLYVSPADYDCSRNPALLARLLESPHGYFRFINIPFSQEVCRRFGSSVEGTPVFNLHGDAHLEQYAITDLGRGLTDFDDSSTGPAVVDLLRFGASLDLLCRDHDCGDTAELFGGFLEGYESALEDPLSDAPEPRVAQRLRAGFSNDRQAYLTYEWVDGGYLLAGVGSALDVKYLVKSRGPTDDPQDDVVLEIKQVRELSQIECINVSKGTDPFRVLLGQSRIAYEPYGHLGYSRFRGKTFWIHAWVENYEELELGENLTSTEEIAEVVYDIGVQLGRGHPNQIGEPLGLQLRREQLRILERDRARMTSAVKELADLTVAAWKRFRDEAS